MTRRKIAYTRSPELRCQPHRQPSGSHGSFKETNGNDEVLDQQPGRPEQVVQGASRRAKSIAGDWPEARSHPGGGRVEVLDLAERVCQVEACVGQSEVVVRAGDRGELGF